MSQEISLFSGYNQRENRLTNYTMLLVKLLYDESPKLYRDFLQNLIPNENIDPIPTFTQQLKRSQSIPDACIAQTAYTIYFETKDSEWFYDDQMGRHLDELARDRTDKKILIALSPFESGGQRKVFESFREMYAGKVGMYAFSFQDFINALPKLSPEARLAQVIDEYKAYLTEQGMLGTWESWIDVVNCAARPNDVVQHLVYTCPAKSGAYTHYRCKFLGSYSERRVTHVTEIRGLVDLYQTSGPKVLWKNDDTRDSELIELAKRRSQLVLPDHAEDLRVFVLSDPSQTDFKKDTPGGMYGHKQYFDLSIGGKLPRSAPEAAEMLRGRSWSEFKKAEV